MAFVYYLRENIGHSTGPRCILFTLKKPYIMHKKILLTVLAILPLAFGAHAKQPPLPVACIDSEYLMKNMPEYARVQADLQVYEDQLKKQMEAAQRTLEAKQKILEKKAQAYQQAREAVSQGGKQGNKEAVENDANLKKLENEAQALYQELQYQSMRLRELGTTSQEKVYRKAQELYKPLEEKIADAARTIAEQRGYGAVQPKQLFIYVHPSHDITKAVAKVLGIKEKKKAADKEKKSKKQKK